MSLPWARLIRFKAADGRILRGEPLLPEAGYDIGHEANSSGLKARIIIGEDYLDTTGATVVSEEIVDVQQVLGPLARKDVPSVRCVGLNFKAHIKEAGRTEPPYPSIFIKPSTSIHDHGADIIVPKICQNDQADYEAELCFIVGKDAKDVPKSEASQYIAAYTCGNDVSSRKWQRDPKYAGGVPQWSFSKGFDTYAPLGPCLVSAQAFGDASQQHLKTVVNGEVRQDSSIGDLLFTCEDILSFLSQGTTLERGTVVMTGTPGGVGDRMKPPKYLAAGDVIEVSISNIGTLRNGVRFA